TSRVTVPLEPRGIPLNVAVELVSSTVCLVDVVAPGGVNSRVEAGLNIRSKSPSGTSGCGARWIVTIPLDRLRARRWIAGFCSDARPTRLLAAFFPAAGDPRTA